MSDNMDEPGGDPYPPGPTLRDLDRKALIEEHEIHLTPDAYAEAIVNALPYQGTPQSILEPSAGQGAFIRALRKRWPTASISAVDIIPEFEGICRESGASKFVAGDIESIASRLVSAGRKFDLICGNPPFSLAERHCRALFPLLATRTTMFISRTGSSPEVSGMLAFLLRSAFLATKERRPFWEWIYSTEAPVGFTWRLPIETRTTFKQPTGWPELLSKSGKKRGSDTHEYETFCFEAGRMTIPVSPRPIRVSQ